MEGRRRRVELSVFSLSLEVGSPCLNLRRKTAPTLRHCVLLTSESAKNHRSRVNSHLFHVGGDCEQTTELAARASLLRRNAACIICAIRTMIAVFRSKRIGISGFFLNMRDSVECGLKSNPFLVVFSYTPKFVILSMVWILTSP